MKSNISIQVDRLKRKIDIVLDEIDHNPSSRNLQKITDLRNLKRTIASQNTWPFDTKSVSAAFIAVFFPIIMLVIDKIWSF